MNDWRYAQGDLVLTASKVGTRATITWRGVSDARQPATFLNPAFKEVVELLRGSDVTVDFTKLEYMNSATVGPLLNLVRLLDANQKPVLLLFSDADWQRTHSRCMTANARTLQNVKVEARHTAPAGSRGRP